MNIIAIIMTVFSCIGALDRIIGNRFGLGREFEKGLTLFGPLALSMMGMIIISPLAAELLSPALDALNRALGIDPSIVTSLIFANDMGGATLAADVAKDAQLGGFNGLVVASMMGCTISFTVPYALSNVNKNLHEELLTGLLCGVATIPVGCIIGGLIMGVSVRALIIDMLPLIIFSALVAAGLIFIPRVCTRLFALLGRLLQIIITAGLALGIIRFLTGFEPVKGLGTLEDAAAICLNASIIMTGAFPLLHILSRLLRKPLALFGSRVGINEASAMGFVSTLAASMTTFEMMERMDRKGVALNSAFSVSAAFVLADHLAFTLAYDPAWLAGVIPGKLISGICALAAANFMYGRRKAV